MKPRLVIMAKAPRVGCVKTRLGAEIGMVEAAQWYRRETARTIRTLIDRRWETVLAITPDNARVGRGVWPFGVARIPQGDGHLGQRMARLLKNDPARPTCVVGSDIPFVTKAHIRQAFSQLSDHDAVIGPAEDGGYWLIGLGAAHAAPRGFLENVRWSTEHARADTLASAPSLRWAEIDTLFDVDTKADWLRWQSLRR